MIGAQLRQDVSFLLAASSSLTSKVVGGILHSRSGALEDAFNQALKDSVAEVKAQLGHLPAAGTPDGPPTPVTAVSQAQIDAFIGQVLTSAQKIVDADLIAKIPFPFNGYVQELNDSIIEPFLKNYLSSKITADAFNGLLTAAGVGLVSPT